MLDPRFGETEFVCEAVSRVVDSEMIEKWLLDNCSPSYDNGTRRAHTNAMNFHHVLDAFDIKEWRAPLQSEDLRNLVKRAKCSEKYDTYQLLNMVFQHLLRLERGVAT